MEGGSRWRKRLEGNIREVVFGLEDSLVSTLGAVTGIAAGTGNSFVVILSGIVLIFVEALSMSAGSYLSSKSVSEAFEKRQKQDTSRLLQEMAHEDESLAELLKRKKFSKKEIQTVLSAFKKERKQWLNELVRFEHRFAPAANGSAVQSGIVMGLFYLAGGIFPLLPYFFLPVGSSIAPSIIITGIILFLLGIGKARVVSVSWVKSGLEMTAISLTAALLGFFIGRVVATVFGIAV